MSYILDALKKADAERERSAVPGLHSHPAPLVMEPETGVRALGPVAWVLAALLGVLVVLLGWRWLSPGGGAVDGAPPAPPASAGPSMVQSDPAWVAPDARRHHPAPDGGEPMGSVSRQVAIPGTVAEPSVDVAGQRPPRAALSWPTQVPSASTPALAAAETARKPNKGDPVETAASTATAALGGGHPSTSGSEPSSRTVVAQSELPEAIRRELPQLVVGGAMYAESPRSRMVVLNGQVFHEGDQPAPDTTLEEIRLKSAVLRYKGHRYLLNY